jgi:hypothetical protein
MGVLQAISDAISAFASGRLGTAMLGLAAIGTITMALLQVLKEITPARRIFNQWWFESWIDACLPEPQAPKKSDDDGCAAARAKAKTDIVELATGGLSNALYDLPVEDMVVQMNLAAQVTLDAPKAYEVLLRVLARGAPEEDLTVVVAGQEAAKVPATYFDARTRVARRIQRNLDGVRIASGNRWQWILQGSSIVLTIVAVELAVTYSGQQDPLVFIWAIPVAFVGSYFAPITRDIVAGIQKLRKK